MRFALILLGLASASAQFKVDVQLVRLPVNVKNSSGDLIGSLDRKEFSVYDNGIPQDIAVFERYTTQPLSVAILIDTSASTAKDLRYETVSIGKFLTALFGEGNEQDMAALYSFNYEVTLLRTFTRSQRQLEDRLRSLRADSGTSVYDAIYFAAQELRGRPGRHVIVIVTDGGDTTSAKKYKDALESAQRAEAIMYPIVVVPITNDAGRNTGGEHALQTLASSTGGRWFDPDVGERLDQAFTEILRDLRAQYMIGYYPKGQAQDVRGFHTVRVELNRRDLRAFTRTGYYGVESR
ncbi:MAG: VWA domain-containing protein [Bryobacteraceae bacterium]|jgi:Ca-activated chloride channel family protein